MGDNGEELKGVGGEGKEIELRIVLDKEGMKVHGPLQDDILCYGMLEKARMVVADYQRVQKKVVIPQRGLNFRRIIQ